VQATFTTKELRELGELIGCEVVVSPSGVEVDPFSAAVAAEDRVAARNLEVIREWAGRAPGASARRIHVHFFWRPVEIRGSGRVESIVLERTSLDAEGALRGTGEVWELPCDLVVRSVGYRGVGLPGVPFDEQRGVVVHTDGRVSPGLYVAGWIKRGPSGIIGTNKKDAAATVATLLADAPSLLKGGRPDGIEALVEAGSVVDFNGWRRIDAAEIALGARNARDRTTIHTWDGLRAAAGSVAPR
jgi:ferredoxin--NADP+ reductase